MERENRFQEFEFKRDRCIDNFSEGAKRAISGKGCKVSGGGISPENRSFAQNGTGKYDSYPSIVSRALTIFSNKTERFESQELSKVEESTQSTKPTSTWDSDSSLGNGEIRHVFSRTSSPSHSFCRSSTSSDKTLNNDITYLHRYDSDASSIHHVEGIRKQATSQEPIYYGSDATENGYYSKLSSIVDSRKPIETLRRGFKMSTATLSHPNAAVPIISPNEQKTCVTNEETAEAIETNIKLEPEESARLKANLGKSVSFKGKLEGSVELKDQNQEENSVTDEGCDHLGVEAGALKVILQLDSNKKEYERLRQLDANKIEYERLRFEASVKRLTRPKKKAQKNGFDQRKIFLDGFGFRKSKERGFARSVYMEEMLSRQRRTHTTMDKTAKVPFYCVVKESREPHQKFQNRKCYVVDNSQSGDKTSVYDRLLQHPSFEAKQLEGKLRRQEIIERQEKQALARNGQLHLGKPKISAEAGCRLYHVGMKQLSRKEANVIEHWTQKERDIVMKARRLFH